MYDKMINTIQATFQESTYKEISYSFLYVTLLYYQILLDFQTVLNYKIASCIFNLFYICCTKEITLKVMCNM